MVLQSLLNRLERWRSSADANERESPGEATVDSRSGSSVPASDEATTNEPTEAAYAEASSVDADIAEEDLVLRVLVRHNGRAEFPTVLEETGLSEEELAGVVATMEADDQISAIETSGKRLICRRGFEPKGYRAHLEG